MNISNQYTEVQLLNRQLLNIQNELNTYRIYLLQNDRGGRTVKRHIYYLSKILQVSPSFDLTEIDLFLMSLRGKGCKNTYLNHIIATIRTYADFKGLTDFRKHFKYRKEEIFIKATMSDEEIEAFLNMSCPAHGCEKDWYKFKVFFSIMAFTGMRPLEVAALTINDVDWGRNCFIITQGKTANSLGAVPIPPNIRELVKNYLFSIKGNTLFPPKISGKSNFGLMTTAIWNNAFHKRIKLLGIQRRNLTPYSLRHSYGTRLAEANINLYTIKKLMRHADIKVTEKYMHLTTKDLEEAQAQLPLIRRYTEPAHILKTLTDLIGSFRFNEDQRFDFKFEQQNKSFKMEVVIKD